MVRGFLIVLIALASVSMAFGKDPDKKLDQILKKTSAAALLNGWLAHKARGRMVSWPMRAESVDLGIFNHDVVAIPQGDNVVLRCRMKATEESRLVLDGIVGQQFECRGEIETVTASKTVAEIIIGSAKIVQQSDDPGAAVNQAQKHIAEKDAAMRSLAAQAKAYTRMTEAQKREMLLRRKVSGPSCKEIIKRLGSQYTESQREEFFNKKVKGQIVQCRMQVADVKIGMIGGVSVIGRSRLGGIRCEMADSFKEAARKLSKGQMFTCLGKAQTYSQILGVMIFVDYGALE